MSTYSDCCENYDDCCYDDCKDVCAGKGRKLRNRISDSLRRKKMEYQNRYASTICGSDSSCSTSDFDEGEEQYYDKVCSGTANGPRFTERFRGRFTDMKTRRNRRSVVDKSAKVNRENKFACYDDISGQCAPCGPCEPCEPCAPVCEPCAPVVCEPCAPIVCPPVCPPAPKYKIVKECVKVPCKKTIMVPKVVTCTKTRTICEMVPEQKIRWRRVPVDKQKMVTRKIKVPCKKTIMVNKVIHGCKTIMVDKKVPYQKEYCVKVPICEERSECSSHSSCSECGSDDSRNFIVEGFSKFGKKCKSICD